MKTELYKKANRIISQISYLQNVRDKLKYSPIKIIFLRNGNQQLVLPTSLSNPKEDGEKGVQDIADKLVEDSLKRVEEKIQSLRTEFENL